MRKTKIWAISLFLIPIIMAFPIIVLIFPSTLTIVENGGSNEELNISTESGGGYIMNTDAIYSWIEIQTSGIPMTISFYDDSSDEISFTNDGWTFTFYETVYNSIEVSTNGWMSFTNLGDTGEYCHNIPNGEIENFDCVALLGEDLDPSYSGKIHFQFFGSEPNRYLVIEYIQIYSFGEELVGDFEVIFYENGNIKFQYKVIHDIQWFFPIIGLDHGDLVNYNRYDAELPLNSKAIEFTFNKMIKVEYGFNFDTEDSFSWLVLEINHSKMDQFFGITWETDFGLYPNVLINEKTKINISSIVGNSTHWEINYNTWDWIGKNDTFNSSYDGNDSISYRKEPLNYTSPHLLPNYYPFLLPNFTLLYLNRANLDNYYDTLGQYNFGNILLESYFYISLYGEVIFDAFYSPSGILEELKVINRYEDEENYIEEVIFLMVRYIEGPKPFYVGVNEGEIYEYGVFYSLKNAPPGFSNETFENIPDRIKIFVDFVGGEDPKLNRALVIITLSGRIDNIWTELGIFENFLYRTTEDIKFLLNYQYVESLTINWETYASIIENSCDMIMPGMYTVAPLDNGIKISTGIMGINIETIMTYNSTLGILNILSERYNSREFFTFRLNDFDYKIKEGDEAIQSINPLFLSIILLATIIIIAKQIKRKITCKT
ncbi:MAG: hypothetical protein ACFFA6_04660 [Promethearchaeota archaeon]